MAQVTGKLMWGQAGEYDAIDDRQVISAALQGIPGIWIPPNLAAGPGLQITLDRFVAALPCADGTVAVAEETNQITLETTAGPTSGSRTDVIWLAADPDNAQWTLDVIETTQTSGLLGLALGQLTMPAGANLATQATFNPAINNLVPLRCFTTNAERRQTFASHLTRWGPGWGALSAITTDEGTHYLQPTGSYHLDIASPRRTAGQWEMLWHENVPPFIQSGHATVTTTQYAAASRPFPIPYTTAPLVFAITTNQTPGFANVDAISATSFSTVFRGTNGLGLANTSVDFYWISIGRILVDDFA